MEKDLSWVFSMKTIAVVGISRDKTKPSYYVPKYLKENGFTIIPVNLSASEILGEKVYTRLSDIPLPVDIILMFRPSEEIPDSLKDILLIHPRVLWMQQGIHNDEVRQSAEAHGIYVVMDRCMMIEHRQIYGD